MPFVNLVFGLVFGTALAVSKVVSKVVFGDESTSLREGCRQICLSVNRRKYSTNSWPRELRVDGPKVGDVFVAHWWVNALAVSKVVSKVVFTCQRFLLHRMGVFARTYGKDSLATFWSCKYAPKTRVITRVITPFDVLTAPGARVSTCFGDKNARAVNRRKYSLNSSPKTVDTPKNTRYYTRYYTRSYA